MMPLFLIIIIEIFVRLLILAACATGAYFLFAGMKNSHPILGSLVGILALIVIFNIFVPSSYAAKNRMTFQHTYTAAEKKANHRHAVAASESRIAASESRAKESSIEKVAAAKQHIKETTGLSGLKYQVNKALKHDDVLAFYTSSSVSVKGVDTSKPYFANIQINSNKESKDTMKDSAASVVKGIQKMKYSDFNTIKISYVQDLQDTYGHKEKNVPVIVYTFKPKTIKQMVPGNMSVSDVIHAADGYINKPVEGE